jgi:hypothetical protein
MKKFDEVIDRHRIGSVYAKNPRLKGEAGQAMITKVGTAIEKLKKNVYSCYDNSQDLLEFLNSKDAGEVVSNGNKTREADLARLLDKLAGEMSDMTETIESIKALSDYV